jgi:hypothetical protein
VASTPVETARVYERILVIIFQRLSPTFGQRTIAAIAKNAIARQGKKHPVLKHLSVSENGVEWAEFDLHLGESPPEEIDSALEAFLDEFFEALSNLIGRLIMGKMFREAEEQVMRGGDEL